MHPPLTSKHELPKARGAPLPANAFELLAEKESATNPRVEKSECDVRVILGMWGVYAVRPAEAEAQSLCHKAEAKPSERQAVLSVESRMPKRKAKHAGHEQIQLVDNRQASHGRETVCEGVGC